MLPQSSSLTCYYFRAEGELHIALPPLTAEERFDRLRICAGLLQRSNKESLLSRLVTCGEKWILYDTEKRTARCIDERDLTKEMKPHYKLQLLTVWWSAAGLIHYNFFKGPLTSASYCQELLNMHKKLLKYQKAMFYGRCPVLLQDDSRSYVKDGSIRSLFTLGYEVLTYPSRSQDLLPTEFHIFPAFNNFLAEQTFDCENIEGAFENFLRSRATAFFQCWHG
ncbi:hypothetical protein OESDEN_17456 [Oesophagostomum dentatum]|uniref:Transposase n=1 Tax=Oesophagostomum dentatum TaxID=61180 RepID=A0A0B1SD36_OESDE|nr:hypothetical protein OESDEN_17456 [Oesophagostomum dentatum]